MIGRNHQIRNNIGFVPRHPQGFARRGLTLLEILLAMTIFFGSVAVLSQLAWSGARSAVQARLKTQAIVRCETKLAEILAGIEMLQPKSNVPFTDDSHWNWSLVIGQTNFPELLQLDVTVSHSGNSRLSNASFSLRRWMHDPSTFMNAAVKQKSQTDQDQNQ